MITPLDETRRALLADERRLLAELRDWLVRLGAPEEQRQALADSIEQLEEPFLLVVVGEFNAGKSAFINALLGMKALEEGVTPSSRAFWPRSALMKALFPALNSPATTRRKGCSSCSMELARA